MEFKNIFITGGGGYCGSRLVPYLLSKNYFVTVYDTFYFGEKTVLKNNKNLNIVNGDIRDTKKLQNACLNHEVFIHLACISNDASFELDEKLSKEINFNCFEPMVIAAKKSNIKRFIYASTSSVYGVSKERDVKEDHPFFPITSYNKFKGMCESLLLKHTSKNFEGVIFRPATVCGFSPRQRFDLSVNILTAHAILKNVITVFGGDQLRPNLHIRDYCEFVLLLIKSQSKAIYDEKFNVGYQNMSIKDIATLVKNVVLKEFKKEEVKIIFKKSNDPRSYHITSEKAKSVLGFSPKYSIENAIVEICDAFKKNFYSNAMNNLDYYNVKKIKALNIK